MCAPVCKNACRPSGESKVQISSVQQCAQIDGFAVYLGGTGAFIKPHADAFCDVGGRYARLKFLYDAALQSNLDHKYCLLYTKKAHPVTSIRDERKCPRFHPNYAQNAASLSVGCNGPSRQGFRGILLLPPVEPQGPGTWPRRFHKKEKPVPPSRSAVVAYARQCKAACSTRGAQKTPAAAALSGARTKRVVIRFHAFRDDFLCLLLYRIRAKCQV